MPKTRPILQVEVIESDGSPCNDKLTEKQLDWLAAFFAPMVRKSIEGQDRAAETA